MRRVAAALVALYSVALTGLMLVTASPPAYVTLPAYGAGQAPQPAEPPPPARTVEERLASLEAKVDELLRLIKEELAAGQPPAAQPPGQPGQPAQPQAPGGGPPRSLVSAATKCAGCHGPAVAERQGGGFTLFAAVPTGGLVFAPLSERQRGKVVARLRTNDPSFQMPPPKSLAALTPEELAALLDVFEARQPMRNE